MRPRRLGPTLAVLQQGLLLFPAGSGGGGWGEVGAVSVHRLQQEWRRKARPWAQSTCNLSAGEDTESLCPHPLQTLPLGWAGQGAEPQSRAASVLQALAGRAHVQARTPDLAPATASSQPPGQPPQTRKMSIPGSSISDNMCIYLN